MLRQQQQSQHIPSTGAIPINIQRIHSKEYEKGRPRSIRSMSMLYGLYVIIVCCLLMIGYGYYTYMYQLPPSPGKKEGEDPIKVEVATTTLIPPKNEDAKQDPAPTITESVVRSSEDVKVSSHGEFGTYRNPNGLPAIRQIGPNSFYRLLLPIYYAKSAVIDRDPRPKSHMRDMVEPYASACAKSGDVLSGSLPVDDASFANFKVDNGPNLKEHLAENPSIQVVSLKHRMQGGKSLCSWGPDATPESIVTNFRTERDVLSRKTKNFVAMDGEVGNFGQEPPHFPPTGEYTALTFHDICVSHNLDSTKQVQRALILIDPANTVKERCVPCPNPLLVYGWFDHACGMMWNGQLNIQNLQDFPSCYRENKEKIRECGQRQRPGENERPDIATVYPSTTLLFSFTINNPGHQVFDSMFPWIPLAFANPKPFQRVAVHQAWDCPNSQWICALARKIGIFEDSLNPGKENLIPIYPKELTCFENIIVPRSGWSRRYTLPAIVLENFRDLLFKKFQFDPESRNPNENKKLLVYAHNTKGEANVVRRAWLNIQDVASSGTFRFDDDDSEYSVTMVEDFARIPMERQAWHFFTADVVVMPHGGQFGNAIFCRPGTVVVEMSCSSYSHLAQVNHVIGFGQITGALGLLHVIVSPCKCHKHSEASNFEMDPDELRTIVAKTRKFFQDKDKSVMYNNIGSFVYHSTIDRQHCLQK